MQERALQDLVGRLNAADRELYEERAAVREFDGLQPRDHAEAMALLDILRRNPLAIAGVEVLEVKTEGRERCALVTDRTALRFHLVCTVHRDLAAVISERFDGAALLSPTP